jgi:signal transduction histidine kinase
VEEIRLTAAGHIFVLSNDQPLTIFADRQKIGSVISNFLSNAAKYSPKGKLIQLISQLKRRP